MTDKGKKQEVAEAEEDVVSESPVEKTSTNTAPLPREIGGRDGPDPTRYGDWEKNGRCIDF